MQKDWLPHIDFVVAVAAAAAAMEKLAGLTWSLAPKLIERHYYYCSLVDTAEHYCYFEQQPHSDSALCHTWIAGLELAMMTSSQLHSDY